MNVKRLNTISSVICGIIAVASSFAVVIAIAAVGWCIWATGQGADNMINGNEFDKLGGLLVSGFGIAGIILSGVLLIISAIPMITNIIAVVMGRKATKNYCNTNDIRSFITAAKYKLILSSIEEFFLLTRIPSIFVSMMSSEYDKASSAASLIIPVIIFSVPFAAVIIISSFILREIKLNQ